MQKIKQLFLDRPGVCASVGLVLVASSLFLYTVWLREPWFGFYSGKNHDWLTASTVFFAGTWIYEGVLETRFGLFENPSSPEVSDFLSRLPYVSYPPGAVIPVFLISVIAGLDPSAGMVMAYNLANHLLITIVLALTVFFLFRSLKVTTGVAFLYALVPIAIELLLPGTLYFHQNSFFADQAVILPFVGAVFLEVLRGGSEGRRRRVISTIQGLVIFYGIFTEWLFVFVAAALYAKRLLWGEIDIRRVRHLISESLRFAIAPVAGLAAFAAYITVAMWEERRWAFENIKTKFFQRSGGTEGSASLAGTLADIREHVVLSYGRFGEVVVYLSVLFLMVGGAYLISRKWRRLPVSPAASRSLQLAFIVTLPAVMHILVLRQHAGVHSYSVLKLSPMIALVPFALAPFFIAALWRERRGGDRTLSRVALTALLPAAITAGVYLGITHPGYRDMFGPKNEYWYRVVEATNSHIEPDDIVFSPEIEVPEHPPQLLSLTRKRVYGFDQVRYVRELVEGAEGDFRVVLMFWDVPGVGSEWREYMEAADEELEDDAYYLYFSPETFLRLLADEEARQDAQSWACDG